MLPSLRDLVRNRISPRNRKILRYRRAKLFEAFGSDRYSLTAHYAMDSKLLSYLDHENGTYIEAGANDGFTQSNTYYLHSQKGWRGVLIEPIPDLYQLCRRFRPRDNVVNCALGEKAGEITIEIHPQNDLMSHVAQAGAQDGGRLVKVPVRSISSIMDENKLSSVDFFSLDVEGFEMAVLSGVDFSRHSFNYMLIESDNIGPVAALLAPWYDQVDQLTYHDYMFKLRQPVRGDATLPSAAARDEPSRLQ